MPKAATRFSRTLDYAQDFKPDAIIDAATLTGAVAIALGKHCCAVLGNNTELNQFIRNMGDACGERIWELPSLTNILKI